MNRSGSHPLKVRLLPSSTVSLAGGIPPSPMGTIFVLASGGGITATPRRDFTLLFGRNEQDVHVCIGADDPRISRCHGRLVCDGSRWWIRNEGGLPIRLPGASLLLTGHETALRAGYTPLFIRSSPRREHLLEVSIAGPALREPAAQPHDETCPYPAWPLGRAERMVLTALAQRYLRHEPYPQPQSWKEVAQELNAVRGEGTWTPHRAANVVGEVRARLAAAGVNGLTREEVGEPIGNSLNHHLIQELVQSTSLTPEDLDLLDGADG
jgi:hypothetical protein